MNKLCFTFLTLAVAAPALAHARDDRTPPLSDTAAVTAAVTASAAASATATIKISDQDALGDDILSVINLPIAAADAREAGVEEAELKEALEVSRDTGLSAGDASEVIAEEAEQSRTRGVKKGFGRWVKMQVAAGLRGKKLAAKIKERKKDTAELDEKQIEDLKAKLEKQRELNKQYRVKLHEKRQELVAKGKAKVILHQERNDKLKAKIDAAQAKNEGEQDDLSKRLADLDARIAAASDADKAALEAEKKRLEKELGKNEKREDKLEKREDKLDKVNDKLDKAGDKLDKAGDKLDKRDAKVEAKADAKADAKAAKAADKAAKPGAASPQ
jgi:DNA repair exonuclease SbcCD ATPase subunit